MRRDPSLLTNGAFDIVVIGGGMHGAWIAYRGATAGYRVALVERDDFGGATSANSLSILHGGLRYLQHLDFSRMRNSIRSRREFARLAPHLVQPLPCIMPLQSSGVRSPWILGPALLVNDIVSADRNRLVVNPARLPTGRLLSSRACRARIAPLADTSASAGALWWDYLSLDTARLNLEVVLAAAKAGAVIANRVEATAYLTSDRTIRGVIARDRNTSQELEIRASVVVNAAGPWAADIADASGLPSAYQPKSWVGAMNVVLKPSPALADAVALSTATRSPDGAALLGRTTRELFFVPRHGAMNVGTEYTPVASVTTGIAGPPPSAVGEFVAEIARIAPRTDARIANVVAVHWGLLPAEDLTPLIPRKAPIVASGRREVGVDGLVVVIGEKLTSAPAVSLEVLARAVEELRLGHQERIVRARANRVDEPAPGRGIAPALNSCAENRLARRYGVHWRQLTEKYSIQSKLFERICRPRTSSRWRSCIRCGKKWRRASKTSSCAGWHCVWQVLPQVNCFVAAPKLQHLNLVWRAPKCRVP